ncbi:MAG: YidC/Oxa1 family membrane protein insertase [Solirubrobacteraceae bacterium]
MTTLPFAANPLQPLIDAFDWVLTSFHDHVGLSWGMSIIALTVVVRALLIPLTLKQFKSMQALQRLAPEIKALQEKYKDDKQRQQQEMMKFYQENKVNPFGSCLPLVLQLPVFFSLFYMLRRDLKIDICGPKAVIEAHAHAVGKTITTIGCQEVKPGSATFGFIPDLTSHATGAVLIVLLILYVGSQLLSSVLMSVTADRNQRFIMIALPFVFVPFIQSFPAGLLVYWITTNLWTVGQQYLIRRSAGMPVRGGPAVPSPATAAAATGAPAKPTKKPAGAEKPARAAAAKAGSAGEDGTARRSSPPPPPRQRKKKKTGRRR